MPLFSLHRNPRLLMTLIVALAQGFLLGWLHTAVREEFWPFGSPRWLFTFFTLALFVPLTLQLMSEHWRNVRLWTVVATMSALLFYFGRHFGADISIVDGDFRFGPPDGFIFFAVFCVLWLHFIPFLHVRLATGRWRCDYGDLFAAASRQALMLAEAALFTGLFWALLMLWAALFKMLGYSFFHFLFTEPAFAYPFTTAAFGAALYLTGSLDRLVTVAREQLLGMLKWLAPVAGLILVLFAPTLLFKLPHLIVENERAISAAWLLWLVAFTVLLLNAGFQSGRIEQPYPRAIGLFLRIAVPATVIVAGTALYALCIRVLEYGLTVDRFFALVVACVALVYSIGYTLAAVRKGPWLNGIERINVGMAIGLMILLGLTLTPIVSPYRLSAASQMAQALARQGEERQSALLYLRFEAGGYGIRALRRLEKFAGAAPYAKEIREQAASMLKRKNRWDGSAEVDSDALLADIPVYPAGRRMPPELLDVLRKDFRRGSLQHIRNLGNRKPLALFIDLNADGAEECVLFVHSRYLLYTLRDGRWTGSDKDPPHFAISDEDLRKALSSGDVSALPQRWRDLRIGGRVLRFENPL